MLLYRHTRIALPLRTSCDRRGGLRSTIENANPELCQVGYRAGHDGKSVFLDLDEVTHTAAASGDYHAWDSLNARFGLITSYVYCSLPEGMVKLKGVYNMPLLMREYAELPGVSAAFVSRTFGDGPSVCLHSEQGGARQYLFHDGDIDCPAGCIDNVYRLFEVEGDEAPVELTSEIDAASWDAPDRCLRHDDVATARTDSPR